MINSDNETYKAPNSAVLVNQIIGIPLSLDRFLAWVKNEKNTGDLNSHDWKVDPKTRRESFASEPELRALDGFSSNADNSAEETTVKCCLNLPAPAKLNLFLHVIGRKPDGMHLLDLSSA